MNAIKRIGSLSLIAASMAFPGWGLSAETEIDETEGTVSIIGRAVSGDRQSHKFNEYRDVNSVASSIDFNHDSGEKMSYTLNGSQIGAEDVNIFFEAKQHGAYSVYLEYDQTPHLFAVDAITLFQGVGTNLLTVPDEIQTAVNAAGATSIGAANVLNGALFGGSGIVFDSKLRRDTLRAGVDVVATDPLYLNFEVRDEHRDGNRPTFASFNTARVELLEPIDYETVDLNGTLDYIGENYSVSFNANHSKFKNGTGDVAFENPFQFQVTNESNLGRLDLAPSNEHWSATLSGTISDTFWDGNVSWLASIGEMTQNDPFLPWTINSGSRGNAAALANGVTDPTSVGFLPRLSLEGLIETETFSLQYTGRPTENTRLRTKIRHYVRDNKTHHYEQVGYVQRDSAAFSTGLGGRISEPLSHKRTVSSFDYTYSPLDELDLTVGYVNDHMERTNREVASQDDNTYSVSTVARPWETAEVRASVSFSDRGGNYDYTVPFLFNDRTDLGGTGLGNQTSGVNLPFLRKYDEARREQTEGKISGTKWFDNGGSIGAFLTDTRDDYDDSLYGLQFRDRQGWGVEGMTPIEDRIVVSGFFSRETIDSRMKARQWAGAVGNPFIAGSASPANFPGSPSDWTMTDESAQDTWGADVNFEINPEKTDLNLAYTWSKSGSDYLFASDIGTAAFDNNRFDPGDLLQVDDNTWKTWHAKLHHKFNGDFDATIGYWGESLEVEDFFNNGFQHVPVTPEDQGTAAAGTSRADLQIGAFPNQSFGAHVAYGQVSYHF